MWKRRRGLLQLLGHVARRRNGRLLKDAGLDPCDFAHGETRSQIIDRARQHLWML